MSVKKVLQKVNLEYYENLVFARNERQLFLLEHTHNKIKASFETITGQYLYNCLYHGREAKNEILSDKLENAKTAKQKQKILSEHKKHLESESQRILLIDKLKQLLNDFDYPQFFEYWNNDIFEIKSYCENYFEYDDTNYFTNFIEFIEYYNNNHFHVYPIEHIFYRNNVENIPDFNKSE